jgi:hypothetical protein
MQQEGRRRESSAPAASIHSPGTTAQLLTTHAIAGSGLHERGARAQLKIAMAHAPVNQLALHLPR